MVISWHESTDWKLKSSLERAVERAVLDIYRPVAMVIVEEGLMRRFKRQVHHYVSDVPSNDAWMEWQALMQHFGAPTRLLDWTYSFYIAAFFAIESMEPDQTCTIWVFDGRWGYEQAISRLDHRAQALIHEDPNTKNPETVNVILNRMDPIPLIFPINPDRLNERLIIQQGAFLVPGDVSKTFMENLVAMGDRTGLVSHLMKLNITLDLMELEKAIRDLNSMNINRATLFPGVDGFSAQFKNLIFMSDEIAPFEERKKQAG